MPHEFESQEDISEKINTDVLYKIISDNILLLEEPYKTAMILRHLVKPVKSFKQI
jgi:hypothetical protein